MFLNCFRDRLVEFSGILAKFVPLLVLASWICWPTQAQNIKSLERKHIVGYQGWFGCPSDRIEPEWRHFSSDGQSPSATNLAFDLWPDTSELDVDELCDTGLKLPSGQPAYLYSAENPKTVMRHFRWMKENEIDGAALQRFLTDTSAPSVFDRMSAVTRNVQIAAEVQGRGFFIMYDLSGKFESDQIVNLIARDWIKLNKDEKISESPAYIHHRGRPLIGLWGFGFNDPNHAISIIQAIEIIKYFHDRGFVIIGGVPAYWRTLTGDSRQERGWAEVYKAFDILVLGTWASGIPSFDIDSLMP